MDIEKKVVITIDYVAQCAELEKQIEVLKKQHSENPTDELAKTIEKVEEALK